MASDIKPIPSNKVRSKNKIEQHEHEDAADAKRVLIVDEDGNTRGPDNPQNTFVIFEKDGSAQRVIEDTAAPANNRPLPVKLTGFDGDVIITADNLNLETQSEGIYGGSNLNPDNMGLIAHERNVSPGDIQQTQRITAIQGSEDTTDFSQDVSLHDGNGDRISSTDYGASKRVVDTAPFELSVIRGKVPEFTIVRAFGINDNVGVANAEDIWAEGGIYEFPTTAQQISVESDNAADDGIGGGSGGRTLEINGLDENFEEISETITLNGITPVLTTQEFLRVQNARVITAGGSGRNEGIIRGSHGGTVLFHIPSEKNNSFLGIFTIPANKTGYLKKFYAGCVAAQKAAGVKEGRIHLLATDQAEGSVFRHVFCFDISSRATTPFYIPIDFYEPFTEKTDLQIRFIAFSNNTEVTSGMHIMLESIV